MGSSVENFCLRWNDFQANVAGSFRDLRKDCDFFDVSLATADSGTRSLQAHRVILSACSNAFKQMFRQQSKLGGQQPPFIFLRGVKHKDLVTILDFIYHGEVNVAQDELSSFLAVAEELQIKGLTSTKESTNGTDTSDDPEPEHEVIPPPPKRSRKSSPGRKKMKGNGSASGSSEDAKDLPVNDFSLEDLALAVGAKRSGGSATAASASLLDEDDDVGGDDEVAGFDDFFSESAGIEGSSDTSRDFVFSGSENINQFIRTLPLATGGYEYECGLCGHVSKDRSNLKKHIRYVHCGTVVTCKYCLKTYKHKGSLNAHLKSGCSAQRRQHQQRLIHKD